MTDPHSAGRALHTPQTLRYEFREHLGSGGMADVYRARDTELARDVAIKVFRNGDGTVTDLARREREIHLLSAMGHPGLVAVHDAGTLVHDGDPRRYVVMEFVEGRSLAHRLARGPLTARQVADLGAQLADALSYVHRRSVVHGDLKPDNILVSEVPTFGYTLIGKLADFGVARFVESSRPSTDGAAMGTAAYISPEQARGEEVGTPSDVYSLALVLLEALRGDREYSGPPVEAALERLHRPPTIPDDLPVEWRTLLAAMTDDDPAQRPTAHDVALTMQDITRSMIIERRGKREHDAAVAGVAVPAMPGRIRTAALTSSVLGGAVLVAAAVVGAIAGVSAV